MAQIPPDAFADALADLDGDEFAALVAELWAGCGWDVECDGQVVRVALRGESRDLLVLPPRRLARVRRAPTTDEPVDAVVTASRKPSRASLPRGTPADADVIDADDLRERALYGLDGADAEAFAERHLGLPVVGSRWSTSDRVEAAGALRRLRDGSSVSTLRRTRWPLAVAIALLVVVAALAAVGGPAAVLQIPGDPASPGPNGSASSDGVDGEGDAAASDGVAGDGAGEGARENATDDAGDAASDERDPIPLPADLRNLTGTESFAFELENETWNDLYEASPNCERGPRSIARLLSAGFTGRYPERSLALYWRFANPDFRASTRYGSFAGTHRAAYQRVFRADRIDLSEPRRVADDPARVVVDATVRWGDDAEPYEFELRRWPPRGEEPCWVVDRFSPPMD